MKIKSRIVKETSVILTEKDSEQLLKEFQQLQRMIGDDYNSTNQLPMIRMMIGQLVGQAVGPFYAD